MDEETTFMRKQLPPNSFEATLARMLETSTLTSGTIAILLIVAMIYCIIVGVTIPEVLTYSISTIIGFFFGSRSKDAIGRAKAKDGS